MYEEVAVHILVDTCKKPVFRGLET